MGKPEVEALGIPFFCVLHRSVQCLLLVSLSIFGLATAGGEGDQEVQCPVLGASSLVSPVPGVLRAAWHGQDTAPVLAQPPALCWHAWWL